MLSWRPFRIIVTLALVLSTIAVAMHTAGTWASDVTILISAPEILADDDHDDSSGSHPHDNIARHAHDIAAHVQAVFPAASAPLPFDHGPGPDSLWVGFALIEAPPFTIAHPPKA